MCMRTSVGGSQIAAHLLSIVAWVQTPVVVFAVAPLCVSLAFLRRLEFLVGMFWEKDMEKSEGF